MNILSYDEPCCKPVECRDDSIVGRLSRQKRELEERLDVTNKALAALEKNPELTNLLELVKRA